MKNGDKPAMAQSSELWCERIGDCPTLGVGLTKREHFAGLAMQSILSFDAEGLMSPKECAASATQYADALLTELEK